MQRTPNTNWGLRSRASNAMASRFVPRKVATRHTLLTIYRSLAAPHLTYGLMAWGQASKSYLEKLLKL